MMNINLALVLSTFQLQYKHTGTRIRFHAAGETMRVSTMRFHSCRNKAMMKICLLFVVLIE